MTLTIDVNDKNRARYGLIETFTTEETDVTKSLRPDGNNGVEWGDNIRYYKFDKAGLTRPSQTTIALANQQNDVYETYHEFIYTPSITDNYEFSSSGSWSKNITNDNINIRFSIVGGSVNEEFVFIQEGKDSGGTGVVVDVLQGGAIVGTVNTGTDIRIPFYMIGVDTLESDVPYTLKVEFKADVAGSESTIYGNLFQIEQKTVK
jgi:hypothetical protein